MSDETRPSITLKIVSFQVKTIRQQVINSQCRQLFCSQNCLNILKNVIETNTAYKYSEHYSGSSQKQIESKLEVFQWLILISGISRSSIVH